MNEALEINQIPAYQQIASYFEDRIKSGKYKKNYRLPPEREIASKLSVSRETVSKALKLLAKRKLLTQKVGKGTFVSYDTKRLVVLRKIAMIGDAFIRGLRTDAPYFLHLLGGIQDFFSENLMAGVVCKNSGSQFMKDYIDQDLDGVIISSPSKEMYPFIKGLASAKIPYVIISGWNLKGKFNCIDVDNQKGTFEALEYLYDQGHRNIAYWGADRNFYFSQERFAGYKKFLKEKKLPLQENLVLETNLAMPRAEMLKEFEKLIFRKPEPTAVFCAGFYLSMYAIKFLHLLNRKIPDDISLLGFDDYQTFFENTIPAVSAVRQPEYDLGYQAAGMLLRQINGEALPEKQVFLKPELMIRNSCKKI